MRRTLHPRALGLIAALVIAGCAGSRDTLPQLSIAGGAPAAKTGTVRVSLRIPAHKRTAHHASYVSASAKSIAISVGTAPKIVTNLTAGSPGCTTSTPVTCSFTVDAPIGTDTFSAKLYDQLNAGGNVLSSGSISATVVAGKANSIDLVTEGVVAGLALSIGTGVDDGVSQSIPVTLTATDKDGNTIVGPGGYDNGPIVVTDGDTTYTKLQLGSASPSSSVSVDAPTSTIDLIYNGSSSLSSATLTASIPGSSVTNATATLTPTAVGSIAIDTANGSPALSQDILGANLPAWFDNTQGAIATSYESAGLHLVRWPGGSFADGYHWENGGSSCDEYYFDPSSTFDNFMTDVAGPANLDVAITANYGTNLDCNGGGTPSEAAAWATYAKQKGYHVKYWTIGNEVYGSWELDMHTPPNDPTTYANAVAGTNGYYAQIKAADSTAKVGVVVAGPGFFQSWDQTMLPLAAGKFDFVEFHYYAQQGSAGGQPESDSYILGQGITDFADALTSLRSEMTSLGVPSTVPIYVGELNSILQTAGKQSVSITNGLFAGMAMAEAMKQSGVTMGTWWLAFGDCENSSSGANFSSSLYGWQNFGAFTLFSDADSGCDDSVPEGTSFPTARAYEILSKFVGSGSVMRNVTLAGPYNSTTRAYADTLGNGYGILLFNTSETAAQTYVVTLDNATGTSYTATQMVYDKAIYDKTENNGPWDDATTTSLGSVGTSFSVTLQPWSINLITLTPPSGSARHATSPRLTKP